MKKAALLQEIIDLKQEIEYLKEENSDCERQADEIKQLKKENEELKRGTSKNPADFINSGDSVK